MLANRNLEEKYRIFIKNLKYFRKINNLSQEELAEKADLSVSYIKQIEAAKRYKNISLIALSKIANALQINIEDLFDETRFEIGV